MPRNNKKGFLHMIISVCMLFVCLYAGNSFAELKEIYVQSPDSCYMLQKTDGAKVYLVKESANCTGMEVKLPVKVEGAIKHVLLYKDGIFWKKQDIVEFNLDSIIGATEASNKFQQKISISENKYQKEANDLADRVHGYYSSPEFQTKLETEKRRLSEQVFKKEGMTGGNGTYYSDAKKGSSKKSGLSQNKRLYIFISSSMPLSTIRNYASSLDRLRDPNILMVMRGFIEGAKYVGPTAKFVGDSIVKREGCNIMEAQCETFKAGINIDPLLFSRYGITKIPAVVYVPHVTVIDKLGSEGIEGNVKVDAYYVIYGDTSLDYALEVILKETKEPSLDRLISVLRKSFY